MLCSSAKAQQANISGTVKDSSAAVPAATVSLLNANDSSWIRSVLSDDNGAFTIPSVAAGNYFVSVTAVGYAAAIQTVNITGNANQALVVELHRNTSAIGEVTFTGHKPFIEMSTGKVTVNVDGSPAAIGLSTLALLRRMPGLIVDQGGNISMQGKQGVLVLIDDRPTYLSTEQLADYLRTIPADEIGQVELMTQPPAKYDAAGNAGIVNIKRKKIRKSGWNGIATLTAGQGVYPYGLGSALINFKRNKLNLSLSADEHLATGFADWQEYQRLSDPQSGAPGSVTNMHSSSIEHFSIASMRLTADYDMSDKISIGSSLRGGYHTNSFVDRVYSGIFDVPANTMTYNSIYSPEGFIRKDLYANAYFSYKINKARSINFNADYIAYNNSPYQDINNTTYDAQMQPLPDPLLLHSHQPTLIDVYSFKGDYTDTLKDGTKLEAGFKSSLVNTDNNAQFSIYQNNIWMNDTSRTNRFLYKENINALFVGADKVINGKWEAKAGLRAENTNAQGEQQVHDQRFTKSYISLFPTAYISYKKDNNNQFELNYGRRIDRPNYQSINPFIFYNFQYNYSVGNPYLQPQFTNSIELKHSYKNMITTALAISNTTGEITDLLVADNSANTVHTTQGNTGISKTASIYVLFNKDLFKWWSLNAAASAFYMYYSGVVNTAKVNNDGTGYAVNMTNQFNFPKDWKAEFVAYYAGRYAQSLIATSLPSAYFSLGASKKISKASTIKLAIEDPLYINRTKLENNLPGLYTTSTFRYSTRVVSLAYTYNFGSGPGSRETNTPEESKRIK